MTAEPPRSTRGPAAWLVTGRGRTADATGLRHKDLAELVPLPTASTRLRLPSSAGGHDRRVKSVLWPGPEEHHFRIRANLSRTSSLSAALNNDIAIVIRKESCLICGRPIVWIPHGGWLETEIAASLRWMAHRRGRVPPGC